MVTSFIPVAVLASMNYGPALLLHLSETRQDLFMATGRRGLSIKKKLNVICMVLISSPRHSTEPFAAVATRYIYKEKYENAYNSINRFNSDYKNGRERIWRWISLEYYVHFLENNLFDEQTLSLHVNNQQVYTEGCWCNRPRQLIGLQDVS